MAIKQAAEKEMKRMKAVFGSIKRISEQKSASEFYEFAHNYYKDGIYFYGKKQYVEAFEAFIIAWAYIDSGMKIGFFSVPPEHKKYFTI